MSDSKDPTVTFNVILKPSDSSAHPLAANHTNVALVQGIACVDFGFIEPSLLAAITKAAKEKQAAPHTVEGHLVTRVAMDVGVLARLHQQIEQVLVSLGTARKQGAKA